MIEPGLFKLKPYRTLQELEALLVARWPGPQWDEDDADWEELCNNRVHVHRRLLDGESPVLLIAPLVPYTLLPNHKLLRDTIISARMGKDTWHWWGWQDKQLGGYWKEDHTDVKGWLELQVVKCLCQIMGVPSDYAWAAWVSGGMSNAVVTRMSRGFTNALFVRNLDGPITYKYVQFECGRVYNTETHLLEEGRPDLCISRCTGLPFPDKEFADLDERLADHDINLEEIFEGIRANEAMGRNDPYGAAVVAKLNLALDEFPEDFELVKMMHESFTANTATGEVQGGWPACLFRCFKVFASLWEYIAL